MRESTAMSRICVRPHRTLIRRSICAATTAPRLSDPLTFLSSDLILHCSFICPFKSLPHLLNLFLHPNFPISPSLLSRSPISSFQRFSLSLSLLFAWRHFLFQTLLMASTDDHPVDPPPAPSHQPPPTLPQYPEVLALMNFVFFFGIFYPWKLFYFSWL